MRWRLAAAALVIVALLSQSCGLSSGAPSGVSSITPTPAAAGATTPGPSPSQTPALATPSAVPSAMAPVAATATATEEPQSTPVPSTIAVKPELEKGKAQSALVSASSGGKIEAKSASGVTYTLDIPQDALLGDEVITLAPVAQVDGLPLSGGLVGAVELLPDGMRLAKAATLTITVPSGVQASGLIGFACGGSGEDLHLYPVTVDGDKISTSLVHFSSYGGGQGTQQDMQAQLARTPATAESRFEQAIAAAVASANQAGEKLSSSQLIENALRTFFDDHVGPDLKAAETDDQSLDAALEEYWSWRSLVELFGMEDDRFQKEFATAAASLKKALQNAFDVASQKCSSDQDWQRGLEMIKVARAAALLEKSPNPGNFKASAIDSLSAITPQLQVCWKFTLNYDSTITWDFSDSRGSMDIIAHVKAAVPLLLKTDLTSFGGRGDLDYVDYRITWGGASSPMNSICKIATTTTNSTLKVAPLIVDMSKFDYKAGAQQITAVLGPGIPTEKSSWKCSTGASGGTIQAALPFPGADWYAGFMKVNQDREVAAVQVVDQKTGTLKNSGIPHGTYYVYNHFKPAGKPMIALATGTGTASADGGKVIETYNISIVHTPDSPNTGGTSGTPTPLATPTGPKTTDTSALPPELAQIPAPPNFAVVAGTSTRVAPGGVFQVASVSWWGKEAIPDIAAFYKQALTADWTSHVTSVTQAGFYLTYVSKSDPNRTLSLSSVSDAGGIKILETVMEQ